MNQIKFYNSQTAKTYNSFSEIPHPARHQFYLHDQIYQADQLLLHLNNKNQRKLNVICFRSKKHQQIQVQIRDNCRSFHKAQVDACRAKFQRIVKNQFKTENIQSQDGHQKTKMKMLTQEKEYNIFGQTNIKQIFKSVPFEAQIQEARQLEQIINSQRGQQLREIINSQIISCLDGLSQRQKSFSAQVLKNMKIMEIKALNLLWKRSINQFLKSMP